MMFSNDPVVGPFISVDPLAMKYPGLSPYNYTMNNPLRLIDPNGLETKQIGDYQFYETDDIIVEADRPVNWNYIYILDAMTQSLDSYSSRNSNNPGLYNNKTGPSLGLTAESVYYQSICRDFPDAGEITGAISNFIGINGGVLMSAHELNLTQITDFKYYPSIRFLKGVGLVGYSFGLISGGYQISTSYNNNDYYGIGLGVLDIGISTVSTLSSPIVGVPLTISYLIVRPKLETFPVDASNAARIGVSRMFKYY